MPSITPANPIKDKDTIEAAMRVDGTPLKAMGKSIVLDTLSDTGKHNHGQQEACHQLQKR